ncbi:hypothetical protein DsansV1_C03g0026591 [Dioscorea sansibarensis]
MWLSALLNLPEHLSRTLLGGVERQRLFIFKHFFFPNHFASLCYFLHIDAFHVMGLFL